MRIARLLAVAWASFALLGCGSEDGADVQLQVKVESEDEKTFYALGMAVAGNTLGQFKGLLSGSEVGMVIEGVGDALTEGAEPKVEMGVYGPKISPLLQQRAPKEGESAPPAPPAQNTVDIESEDGKTFYALGMAVTSNTLSPFKGMFDAGEIALIKKGFSDGLLEGQPLVEMEVYGPKLNAFLQQRVVQSAEAEKVKGCAYLEQTAAEEGAVKTASGLVYKELQAGTGAQPAMTDSVEVHYTGKLIDGTVFDSSVERGQPIVHPLNGFVPGWSEGVGMMKVGGKAQLVIPPDLAYGDQPAGQIPAGSTLVFEVELLGIK